MRILRSTRGLLVFGNLLNSNLLNSIIVCCFTFIAPAISHAAEQEKPAKSFDVVIYGGTSGGIAAAVQAKRMGKSVVLVEPTNRLGGLTTGGLGQTDIGNKAAVGGIAREFYQDIKAYYQDESAWKWQAKNEYQSIGQSRSTQNEDAQWTFEPHVALKIYERWIAENDIPVLFNERLNRETGVVVTASIPWRIVSISFESGRTINGKTFIDATYEGDLLAAAGVDYFVGREANETYGETLSGIQTGRAIHHQFVDGVDAYVEPGKPESGLLPFINGDPLPADGSGDKRVQAYCFRMCMTDHPENRIPFGKPDGYVEQWYELLFRNFEAGERRVPLSIGLMPNRKTDTNNNFGFSTDFIGQNYDYPEASYERREEIVRQHLLYQQGLMWSLANHPRVPQEIRDEVSKWGMCKDEFQDGNGWQAQLYIREARRLVGQYVMTQLNCQGFKVADIPVGLAAYTMDSHHVQRHVTADGKVRNEGDVQVGGFAPYPIDYRSLVPKTEQCSNLLVPVCLSASHMAFGSIRMEPVFMVLGQSAATAAVHAIDEGKAVQEIDPKKLIERLEADKQVLKWTGPVPAQRASGLDPKKLPGIVVDDQNAKRIGFDLMGHTVTPFVGLFYRHDGNVQKGAQNIVFEFSVPTTGKYEVRLGYTPFDNRATNVPVVVNSASGLKKFTVNQKKKPKHDSVFEPLGTFDFEKDQSYKVVVSNEDTDGFVVADAVQLVPFEAE